MNKKGVSKLIVVALLVLLVLALMVILWIAVKGVIKQQGEFAEIQAQIINQDISIKDVDGDLIDPSHLNITINRGTSKIIVKNLTTIYRQMNIDVFSVIDYSGSMIDGECTQRTKQCTCVNYLSSCTKTKCQEECGGTFVSKIDSAIEANKELINNVLAYDGNKLGFIYYNTSASVLHRLSSDKNSLSASLDTLTDPAGFTCICCGINSAITEFSSDNSGNLKYIILMTDGDANIACPEGNIDFTKAKPDAIDAASNAFNNYSIKVYTIGFGGYVDISNLEQIALAGNGTYSSANINNLKDIYNQVLNQTKVEYEEVQKNLFIKLVFYNDTDLWIYRVYDIPFPLETKEYVIPIMTDTNYEKISDHITNIRKIDIYLAARTESGQEITGPKLDTWKPGGVLASIFKW